MGWPIVGHQPYFNLYKNKSIEYYTKKYGPIFRIKLGSYESVMINDYNLIKKAFRSKDFISRVNNITVNHMSMGGHGLVLSREEIWSVQRRFSVSQLHNLGIGKSSLEATIHEEITTLFTEWKKSIGSPIEVDVNLQISAINIIWSIVAGCIK